MASEIRDINLAESGMRKIEWVRRNCPLLSMLKEEFSQTKPFAGKKIALSIHLEAKTAYLCEVLLPSAGLRRRGTLPDQEPPSRRRAVMEKIASFQVNHHPGRAARLLGESALGIIAFPLD